MNMKKIIVSLLLFFCALPLSGATSSEHYQKGEELMEQKNPEEALFYFKKALEKNPYFSKALLRIARIGMEMQNYAESQRYLDRFLKLAPRDPEGLNLQGDLYLARNNTAGALESFEKSKKNDPLNYGALEGLARVALRQKNYGLAESRLNALLKIDPEREEAYISFARLYLMKKRTGDAEKYVNQGLARHPESPVIYFFKGVLENKKKNPAKARVYFEKSFSYNPASADTILNLIRVYFTLRDWNKAEEFLEKMLVKWPDQSLLHNQLGLARQLNSKPAGAADSFKRSHDLNITDDVVRFHWEDFLVRKKSFYDPDRKKLAAFHFDLAGKHDAAFRYQDALYEYKRGLTLHSENALQRDRLGLLYKKNRLLEKYLKELQAAALLDPENKSLSDRLEKARTFRKSQLSFRLGIDQYGAAKERVRIFLAPFERPEEGYLHFQAGQVIAESISRHLGLYNKFETAAGDADDPDLYFHPERNKLRQMARQARCDYYLHGGFREEADFISAEFSLYSVREDEPLRSFVCSGRGREKLYVLSADAARQLDSFFPARGTILMIRDGRLAVNLGSDDRIKVKDRLAVYSRSSLSKDAVLEQYTRESSGIIGYAVVRELDEQICLAEPEDPALLDRISVNDQVRLAEKKGKGASSR